MERLNLKILGTKAYLDSSKKEIIGLYNKGKSPSEIVNKIFKDFPIDQKEIIKKEIEKKL